MGLQRLRPSSCAIRLSYRLVNFHQQMKSNKVNQHNPKLLPSNLQQNPEQLLPQPPRWMNTRKRCFRLQVIFTCILLLNTILLDKHRSVLNQILRGNTQNLDSSAFAILTHFPKLLDFDVKRKYFYKELKKVNNQEWNRFLVCVLQRYTSI